MDLFNDLAKMGITGLEGVDIFGGPTNPYKAEAEIKKPVVSKPDESELVFEKSVTCAVCDRAFKTLTVKSGRARIVARDRDLRPVFEGVEASKYDVISCPYCGYTALSRYYTPLASVQKKLVLERISSNVKTFDEHNYIRSYEEALGMYKLALVNSMVKMSKTSERAYICMKIGWLLRSNIQEIENDDLPDEALIADLKKQEEEYLKKAYEGFKLAVSEETFPICGMDEYTVDYMLSVFAMRFGEENIAKKLVAEILISKNASSGIKDRARDLKDELIKTN